MVRKSEKGKSTKKTPPKTIKKRGVTTAKKTAAELELASRRATIADKYLRGNISQGDLARELGVSRMTISRDVRILKDEWQESRIECVDESVNIELQRLAKIEAEAWDQWERSKLSAEKSRSSRTNKDGVDTTHKQVETIQQCGDPRYLNTILACIDKRCHLLGLNKPVKVDVEMSPQQRQERLNRLAQRYGLN